MSPRLLATAMLTTEHGRVLSEQNAERWWRLEDSLHWSMWRPNRHDSSKAVLRQPPAAAIWRPQVLGLSTPAQVVIALTVLAAVLRFSTLDVQSVWLDESSTILLVRRSLTGMFSHLYSEETPPLYFVVAWFWTRLFGVGIIGFRSLSALLGTITIPVMYAVGRRISPRVGLWAAALTTVNPAMYYYSQEARCYALLILLSAAALFFWLRVLEDRDGRSLWLWTGMSVLALLTHYFAIFMFIPEAILLVRRLGLRQMLAPVGLVTLTGLALLPLAIWQHSTYGEVSESASTTSRAAGAVKQFLVGLYGPLEIYSALLTGLIAVVAVAYLWRRGEARVRWLALEMGCVAAAALLLPLLLALMHLAGNSFEGRHLISAWIPFALLVAMGLAVAQQSRVGAMLGFALCATSLAVVVGINAIPGYQRDDWRGIAHALPTTASTRVIVGEQHSAAPLSIYLSTLTIVSGPRVWTRELDYVGLRVRRTGRSPLPAVVTTKPPPGFRLAEVHKAEAFAVSRFVAPRPVSVSTAALRRLIAEPGTEIERER
jgi:mannosyltransferase